MKRSNGNTKGVTVQVLEPLFAPGRVVMTPGIKVLLDDEKLGMKEVCAFLARHLTGDWGELDPFDKRQNEDALHHGARLLSAYRSVAGDRLWVITDAVGDGGYRRCTTVLLPEEY